VIAMAEKKSLICGKARERSGKGGGGKKGPPGSRREAFLGGDLTPEKPDRLKKRGPKPVITGGEEIKANNKNGGDAR